MSPTFKSVLSPSLSITAPENEFSDGDAVTSASALDLLAADSATDANNDISVVDEESSEKRLRFFLQFGVLRNSSDLLNLPFIDVPMDPIGSALAAGASSGVDAAVGLSKTSFSSVRIFPTAQAANSSATMSVLKAGVSVHRYTPVCFAGSVTLNSKNVRSEQYSALESQLQHRGHGRVPSLCVGCPVVLRSAPLGSFGFVESFGEPVRVGTSSESWFPPIVNLGDRTVTVKPLVLKGLTLDKERRGAAPGTKVDVTAVVMPVFTTWDLTVYSARCVCLDRAFVSASGWWSPGDLLCAILRARRTAMSDIHELSPQKLQPRAAALRYTLMCMALSDPVLFNMLKATALDSDFFPGVCANLVASVPPLESDMQTWLQWASGNAVTAALTAEEQAISSLDDEDTLLNRAIADEAMLALGDEGSGGSDVAIPALAQQVSDSEVGARPVGDDGDQHSRIISVTEAPPRPSVEASQQADTSLALSLMGTRVLGSVNDPILHPAAEALSGGLLAGCPAHATSITDDSIASSNVGYKRQRRNNDPSSESIADDSNAASGNFAGSSSFGAPSGNIRAGRHLLAVDNADLAATMSNVTSSEGRSKRQKKPSTRVSG